MSDIVIDTNVLMHADDPRVNEYRDHSNQLQSALRDGTTVLCVDEGFSLDPSRNRSLIMGEYLENLQFGMVGFATLSFLAQAERVKSVSKTVTGNVSKKLKGITTRRDRTFVRVTLNTDDLMFVSHDFQDFPDHRRRDFQRTLGISIITAEEAIPHVTNRD